MTSALQKQETCMEDAGIFTAGHHAFITILCTLQATQNQPRTVPTALYNRGFTTPISCRGKKLFKRVDCQAAPIFWEDSGDPFKKCARSCPPLPAYPKSCIKAAVAGRVEQLPYPTHGTVSRLSWNNADGVLVPEKSKTPEEIAIIRRAQEMAGGLCG